MGNPEPRRGQRVVYLGASGTMHGAVSIVWRKRASRSQRITIEWDAGTTYGGGPMTTTELSVDDPCLEFEADDELDEPVTP